MCQEGTKYAVSVSGQPWFLHGYFNCIAVSTPKGSGLLLPLAPNSAHSNDCLSPIRGRKHPAAWLRHHQPHHVPPPDSCIGTLGPPRCWASATRWWIRSCGRQPANAAPAAACPSCKGKACQPVYQIVVQWRPCTHLTGLLPFQHPLPFWVLHQCILVLLAVQLMCSRIVYKVCAVLL